MAGSPDAPRPRRSPLQDDVLAGPADSTRPANPWPRLIAFGAFVVAVVALAGLCVASFASPPDREIRVRDTEYQAGLPKYLAITSFGADEDGRTYGAYLAVPEPESPTASAFFSRAPETGCNLMWDAHATYEGVRGVFVDPCSDARFAFDGHALQDRATADLHQFEVRREANSYVVNFERLILGACRNDSVDACSPEDRPVLRTVPSGELPDDFGLR